jgi:hypothetical protein
MEFKALYRHAGAHYHVRWFEAPNAEATWKLNGTLVLSERAWASFVARLSRAGVPLDPDEETVD